MPVNGFTGTAAGPVILPDLGSELVFNATRSSGPGGQHVNKVSTRIELRFDVIRSGILSDEQKALISEKLASRISQDGILIVVCQTERTQLQNREKATEKFYALILKALTPRKKRTPTKPSRASKEQRLEDKRLLSEKKSLRKPVK